MEDQRRAAEKEGANRRATDDAMIMCRSLSVPANCSRKLGNTCPRLGINCCSDECAWHSADMRAHSTTVDPKCDILFVPDGVLGAGEVMRRREFIALVGSTAIAWPLTARAQQPATPVVGFLSSASPQPFENYVAGFRAGLKETGYVDSQNVAIEFRLPRAITTGCLRSLPSWFIVT